MKESIPLLLSHFLTISYLTNQLITYFLSVLTDFLANQKLRVRGVALPQTQEGRAARRAREKPKGALMISQPSMPRAEGPCAEGATRRSSR